MAAYRRMLPDAAVPLSSFDTLAYSPKARPALAITSTDRREVVSQLKEVPLAKPFLLTSTPATLAAAEPAHRQPAKGSSDLGTAGGPLAAAQRMHTVPRGAAAANVARRQPSPSQAATAPQEAHAFVRDLTLLAHYADAFIVSGETDAGQLAMLYVCGATSTAMR